MRILVATREEVLVVNPSDGTVERQELAAAMRRRSRQKNETTASTVPVWIDASNVSPKRS